MGKPRSIKVEKGVAELLARYDCNPFEELIKMSRESIKDDKGNKVPLLSVAQRIEVWKTLCPYVQPTLRATEVKGDVRHSLTIKYVNFEAPPAIAVEAVKQLVNGDIDDD